MGLPAGIGEDDVALGEILMPGFHHLGHRAALHDMADLHRLGIGFPGVHAPAQIGIEGEVEDAQQDLALLGRGDRRLVAAEVAGFRHSLRPGGQKNPLVRESSHGFPP